MTHEPRFDPRRRAEIRQGLIELVDAAPTRQHARRVRSAVVALVIVASLTATGTAAVALTGGSLFGLVGPAPTGSPAPSGPAPSASPTPSATPTVQPVPDAGAPTVTVSPATFTAPSWGSGVTATVSGLSPDTTYSASIDSRYRGESKTDDGYFSMFSSPFGFVTDASGRAAISWVPDVFPRSFTDSGESGPLLGAYVRIDRGAGPQQVEGTISGAADALVLSSALAIQFRSTDEISVSVQACIEIEQLLDTGPGLELKFTGLVPGEYVVVGGQQTSNRLGFYFEGRGTADASGSNTLVLHTSSSPNYPALPTSAAIAPDRWVLSWSANFRPNSIESPSNGEIPIQIGDCPAG